MADPPGLVMGKEPLYGFSIPDESLAEDSVPWIDITLYRKLKRFLGTSLLKRGSLSSIWRRSVTTVFGVHVITRFERHEYIRFPLSR